MLERTAASLEPCGLRVFSAHGPNAIRSSRRLHTAFWQHGAADVELTRAWLSLMHGTADPAASPDQSRQSPLNASAFLLDFLYPSGAVALMRRLALSSPDRHDVFRRRHRERSTAFRFYNSSISQRRAQKPPPAKPPTAELAEESETKEEATDRESDAFQALQPHDHRNAIHRILRKQELENADLLWRHYKALEGTSDMPRIRSILLFLSRTGRVTDSWKISELFHKLDHADLDNEILAAAVTAEINLQNLTQALTIFENGLNKPDIDNDSLVEVLDLLLATAVPSANRDFLERLWSFYPNMKDRWKFDAITAKLTKLASLNGLAEHTFAIEEYCGTRLSDASVADADREPWTVLLRILVRRAVLSCADSQVVRLLRITDDPYAFEDFIRHAWGKPKARLSIEVYLIYRNLPDVLPSFDALYFIFDAYMKVDNHQKVTGMEMLWGDWYKTNTNPTRKAYQKFLGFYSSRGDKERTYELWNEYVDYFFTRVGYRPVYRWPGYFPVMAQNETFSFLLQVHAVNGEVEETKRIFDYMVENFKVEADIFNWNILLNAHVTANDYDGAVEVFERMSAVVTPDRYTFGTLMHMAGMRGDLGFAVDLYTQARRSHVVPDLAMLIALVDAYCQNDHFKEAEDVCVRAANKGLVETWMWNRILYHYALRRDLAGLNNLLNIMADKNVPYNHFTYEQLLLGLAVCRQSQHALALLNTAIKEKVFEVRPAHFQIVMAALLRTGEPNLVLRLTKVMRHHGFQVSRGILFRISQAFTEFKDLPPQHRMSRTRKEWLGDALRNFYDIYGVRQEAVQSPSREEPIDMSNSTDLLRAGSDVYRFGTITQIFASLSERVHVAELIDLYRYVFHDTPGRSGVLPLPLMTAIMNSGLRDKQFTRVRETWAILFDLTKKEARSKNPDSNLTPTSRLSPRFRYALIGSIRVMQEMFFLEQNPSGLQRFVKDVLDAGFALDSKNWNFYVQYLVQLQQYRVAFKICEMVLMPNWMGWAIQRQREPMRNALPLEVRRKGSDRRHNRPVATTLYRLANGYLQLQKDSLYSASAAATLKGIDSECVQVIRAIKTMKRTYTPIENEIFGCGPEDGLSDTVDIDDIGAGSRSFYPGEQEPMPVGEDENGHMDIEEAGYSGSNDRSS